MHEVDKAGYHRSDVAMLMQQNAGELINKVKSKCCGIKVYKTFLKNSAVGHYAPKFAKSL